MRVTAACERRPDPDDGILLTPAACARMDAAAIAAGTPGAVLMERAGRAVVHAVLERFARRSVTILCGPGNNGGDGWVIARRLAEWGWHVRVASLVPVEALSGDAAGAAAGWTGPVALVTPDALNDSELVVDALFGAGLARPLEGAARGIVEAVRARGLPVVAVDVPSGVDGATGSVLGDALAATLTVTFVRPKPGHVLRPGRELLGELVVAQIGIADRQVRLADEGWRKNGPAAWVRSFPRRAVDAHKYRYGHAVVVGGPAEATGAARLCADAAMKAGAGLVSVVAERTAIPVYACALTSVMTKPLGPSGTLEPWLADPRLNAWAIGPAAGLGPTTAGRVIELLASRRRLVLDADALTSFADRPVELISRLHGDVVLTPHEGELARIAPGKGSRVVRARDLARRSGAVVVLKGPETIVAAPDGRTAIQESAPPDLAIAGTGDVLAGIVLGLLAQGMPGFEAAAAAVWLHAEAARRCGTGLVAEDLADRLAALRADLGVALHGSDP